MTNTSVSSGQRRQIVEVANAAIAGAVNEALGIVGLQKVALQRVLARGHGFQKALFLSPYIAGLMRSYAVEHGHDFFGPPYRLNPDAEQLPSARVDIGLKDISFMSMLRKGEDFIDGETRQRRLREERHLYLNIDHFRRFWKMRRSLPKKWENLGRIRFEATKLCGPLGPLTIHMYPTHEGWQWGGGPLLEDDSIPSVSAVAGKY